MGGVRCGGVAVIDCHLAFLWRVERHIVEQLVGYGSLGGCGCGCVVLTCHLTTVLWRWSSRGIACRVVNLDSGGRGAFACIAHEEEIMRQSRVVHSTNAPPKCL